MMAQAQVLSVAVGVVLTVPMEVLERHTAASPDVVGEELAWAVDAFSRRQHLGYYPPLDYCEDMEAVSEDLLDAAHNIAWLSRELVREEVGQRLSQAFTGVGLEVMQCTAFTMPRVRWNAPNAMVALSRHFTPDSVRVGLTMGLKAEAPPPAELRDHIRQLLWRWLGDSFATVDVTSSRVV